MYKVKNITWKNHSEFANEIQGIFENQEIFTIKPVGKNSGQWILYSWAFRNETFNNSTNSKNLGTFLSVNLAQQFAEDKWNQFVNELLEASLN